LLKGRKREDKCKLMLTKLLLPRHQVTLSQRILSHFNNMGSTARLISFQSDVFELLARHPGSFKFSMDSGVVDINKSICLEEVKQFIKGVVGIVAYKYKKIMDIIVIQNSRSAKKSFLGLHNVSSVLPECQDLVKCAL
jgi:hypothetical protein